MSDDPDRADRQRDDALVRRDMSRMMALFGADSMALPLAAVPDVIAASERCASCTADSHCHAVLEGRASDPPQRFCPNSRLFGQLADELREREGLD